MNVVDPDLPCVHCGLCLDACPTYRELGTEADSPRGRIYIMEAVGRGELELDRDAAAHLDLCLGCLACEPACPSGVQYGRRIEEFRPRLPAPRGLAGAWRRATERVAADQRWLQFGLRSAWTLDAIGLGRLRRRVPGLGLLPRRRDAGPATEATPLARSRVHQPTYPKLRVAVLTGCVADRLLPGLNRAAVEVLQHAGAEVVDVAGQVCCGALDLHGGNRDGATAAMAANVRAFSEAIDRLGVDRIVTTAAGCGAALKDYGRHFADDPLADEARRVAAIARDVCEVVVELDPEPPDSPLAGAGTVVYHDACHLLHAQGVADAPRRVCLMCYQNAWMKSREPFDGPRVTRLKENGTPEQQLLLGGVPQW